MTLEVWPKREDLDRAEIALIAELGFSAQDVEQERAVCVCGNPVDHDHDWDHSPVSAWEYAVFCKAQEAVEKARG